MAESPLRIALRSVRVNAVPMVVLWNLAAGLVLWYYRLPGGAALLEPLARWQSENGWVAAFANRFVFCGVLPGAFMLTMKTLRVRHPLSALAAQALWSGICGVISGWMFELHAQWFGTGVGFHTLLVKTVMQQFVWTPIVFAPAGALVYLWIGCDFSLARCRREFGCDFLMNGLLPNLFANWIVWIPCAFLVHMFPTALQIQLTGFVNAYFCLVLLVIGKRT